MAKGQKRSSKEVKKPKQKKPEAVAVSLDLKGISGTGDLPKKKKG
jgi:hypothetical protein